MPTLVSGQNSYDHPTNYIKIDVFDRIASYDPEATPLLALLTRINKKRGRDVVVRWFEDELVPKWGLVGSTAASTAGTSITMATTADADVFNPQGAAGTLAYYPATGEQLLVTSVSSATLTVTRAYGDAGTPADTIAASGSLQAIGRIDFENEVSVTPILTQPAPKNNVMQIFKDSITFSGSEMEIEKWVSNDREYKLKKLGRDHAVNIERSLWFGQKKTAAANTTARAMDGITRFVTTNVQSLTQSMTQDDVDNGLLSMARNTQGQNKNVFIFGSGKFQQALTKIAKANIQTFVGKDADYGMRLQNYLGAHFDAKLVTHWLFESSGLSTPDLTLFRRAYALNMDFLMYRPLGSRDTTLRMQIQENDRDGEKHEYLTECTIQVMLEKAHSYWKSTVNFL